jgi:hypothetical protein
MLSGKLAHLEPAEALMLSAADIFLHCIVLLFIPLALYSLFSRKLPPDNTLLGRLYRIDPRLDVVSNLFLLALCVASLYRLGVHFGIIAPGLAKPLELASHIPFAILLVVFLTMLVRAALRLRRSVGTDA